MVRLESHKRSIAKAVSWRIFASLVTMTVIYAFTKEWALSAGIGVIDTVIKILGYYFHERLWEKAPFGRREIKEDYTI